MKFKYILFFVFILNPILASIYGLETQESDFVENIQYITDPLELKNLSLSSNPDILSASIHRIRKLLSASKDISKYDPFIESGIIPVLVKHLKSKNSNVVYDATWALTNLASGTSEQTQAVVDGGAIPLLIDLLESDNSEIDNAEYRDQCIELKIIPKLLKFIDSFDSTTDLIRNVAWTMVNLCRTKIPPISIENVQKILPGFEKLINHHDPNTVSDSLWGISYSIQMNKTANEDYIQLLLNNQAIVTRVTELLNHPVSKIQTPALRIVGNIAYGSDEQTQEILEYGILTKLKELLSFSSNVNVIKEILWVLSNILAGPIEQVKAVFDAGLFPIILEYSSDENIKLKNELIWCIRNAAKYPESLKAMMKMGVIQNLSEMVMDIYGSEDNEEEKVLINVLTALEEINVACSERYVAKGIQKSGAACVFAKLQNLKNEEIREMAKKYKLNFKKCKNQTSFFSVEN
uniref:Importin subunit alpha n=1 Tax=Panagrolaimus davidi TaxID=227884 RepID=A0A914P698_9BILA